MKTTKALALIAALSLQSSICIESASAQKAKPITITFSAQDKAVNDVHIQFAQTDTIIKMEAVGDTAAATKQTKGSVTLKNITEPTYGVITYRWKKSTIYFEPGKDFAIAWDLTPAALTATVTSKKSQINPYLNCGELHGPVMGDFGKSPEDVLPLLEDYTNNCYKILDSKKLDKTFVEKERKRIEYWIYGFLAQYAQQKQCDQPVYDKLEELASANDEWLVQMPEFTNFMYSAVTSLALRDMDLEDTPESRNAAVAAVLQYAADNIKAKDVKEYIIGANAVAHIANNGNEGAERIKEIFDANISDPEIQFAFNRAWADGAVLVKGRPSPEFTFPDINGKEVSLKDLRGKYVYIDIWATWCVPCKKELPALKKLEEQFQGMNIAFVSLSCDRDKAAWEKMVREQNLGGIQLWGNEDNDFLRKYRAQAIPRFIFLDPTGRIVNPDMTRPSDPSTVEALGMVAEPLKK